MEYMCTEFGVDSSNHFSFKWWTYAQTHAHAQSQMPLIILPTYRLLRACVSNNWVVSTAQFPTMMIPLL